MTSIRTIMDHLVTLQAGLAISDPVQATILAAYKYPPNRNFMLPDTPCFMNSWRLDRVERHLSGGALRVWYEVTTDLFIQEADLNVGADIASAFGYAYMIALNSNIGLDNTVHQTDLRGGSPTLALLEWGGKPFIGLHLLVDLSTEDGVIFQ